MISEIDGGIFIPPPVSDWQHDNSGINRTSKGLIELPEGLVLTTICLLYGLYSSLKKALPGKRLD